MRFGAGPLELLFAVESQNVVLDAVFLAGMEEGLFPHSQSMNSASDLEEERRLCYVGITRARRKLFLTWARFRRNYGPSAGQESLPSRFLDEMPRELLEGWVERRHDLFDDDSEDDDGDEIIRDSEEISFRVPTSKRSFLGEEALPQPKSLAELKTYIQRQNEAAKGAAPSAGSGAVLKSGMRVRHPQFGDGIILSREKVGSDIRLTITFSRVGRKTLIEKYAKLQAI